MSTEELSTAWLDTLADWRELPSTLAEQAEPSTFRFRVKKDTWIVFMKGHGRGLPDWIAVNTLSGEIRKLYETGLMDMFDVVGIPHLKYHRRR